MAAEDMAMLEGNNENPVDRSQNPPPCVVLVLVCMRCKEDPWGGVSGRSELKYREREAGKRSYCEKTKHNK